MSAETIGPRCLEHTVEVAVRAQRLFDLVEVADCARPEHTSVLLVEAAQDAHAESLPRRRRGPELRAHRSSELSKLALPHRDERAFEPQHQLFGLRPEPQLGGAGDHLHHPQVRLQARDVGWVAPLRLDAVDELTHRALVDRVLAESGQHVRDVIHEGSVRPDHEHAAMLERLPLGEEQPRCSVQADRGLARARPALDHERRVGRVGDQAVLIGLDRRDDVAHVHVAVPFELFEQEVADGGAVDDRSVECLVGDVEQAAPVGAKATAERDAVRVLRGRGVERPSGRRLPVHDELPLLFVVHPAPADVERPRHRLEVEPAEAEAAFRILERPQALGRPGVHGCLGDLAVDLVACRGDHVAHPLEVVVGAIDVCLLRRELRMGHEGKLCRREDLRKPYRVAGGS